MKFFSHHRMDIGVWLLLIAGYACSRLFALSSLPIFTDEAIYVRWAQIAGNDAAWRFISLTDGKQPSWVWIAMVIQRVIEDPLLSGRLVSVGAGLLTMIGMFFLGRELFKNRLIGLVSAGLYIIYPFALVYDRMALYDSMMAMFVVWSLFLTVLMVRTLRLDVALLFGLVAGAGVLTKSNAFLNIYLLPFSLILFDLSKQGRVKRLLRWIGLSLVVVILAYGLYSILRLSPLFHMIDEKNTTFVYPFREWIQRPFAFFIGNSNGLWDWFITYTGWHMVLLIGAAFLYKREYWREKLLCLAWAVLPFIALAFFGKVLYPRYMLPMTMSLIPLMALGAVGFFMFIAEKGRRMVYVAALVIFFLMLPWIYTSGMVVTQFPRAPIPMSDLNQYSNDWPAGGGVNELVALLREEAKKGQLYVLTEGTFGSVPTLAIEIYLDSNPNILKRGLYPIPDRIPQDLLDRAKDMPVYVVFNQSSVPPFEWQRYLVPIARYQKGIGSAGMSVFQVRNPQ